jgi:hypothetical protein
MKRDFTSKLCVSTTVLMAPEMPIAGGVTIVVVLKVEAELPNSPPTMPLRVHRPQYASNSPAA